MSLWFEITATVPPDEVETISALMREVAPGGVSVEESVDILGPEMGFRVRRDEPVLVRAYLPGSELGALLTEELRTALAPFPSVELVAKPIFEQDWAVSWREFFGVVETGGRIVVVPSWIEHEVRPGQIAIRVDPGQAFGTGHHETTRLCLLALDELVKPGESVLDVGTGSGILAIAAVLLGAASVRAIDIDPIVAEVAGANCRENGVEDRVTIEAGTLSAQKGERFDLAVANISTQANMAMAPAFARVLNPGGRLVLSGILSSDAERVREAMEREGLRWRTMREERDWCLIEFERL